MNAAYKEAARRLGNETCGGSREIYFIFTEIGPLGKKGHWHYSGTDRGFVPGLPTDPSV